MAWSMPNSAHWNSGMSGMAMTPDMNMGSYTPEQWAAMQQQNWQQWAQWQQQYAQWQSQYGEKYAEQMQTLQALAGMPPLPPSNSAPPPAPPPPDKPPPPPPPPHENNQPLFVKTQSLPAPVPAPAINQQRNNNSTYTHVKTTTGNNQWSYGTDTTIETVNAEALKKLAEEERLFDIQFQKWEEEIEKWRRENVNHPDKQAYQEYEQKFEACRAQLMERRKQMNQKKACLLTNMPPATSSALPGKSSTAVPPKMQNVNKNNYSQNNKKPSQNFQNKPAQDYPEHNKPQYQQQQYKAMPQNTYNKNVDPQDRYESYQNMSDYSSNDNYQSANPDNSIFLPTSGSSKAIPGLDLVPDTAHPSKKLDVIDITEERFENQPQQPQAPDYLTISKGIYNILGDEKIMNILSMFRGHNTPPLGPANNNKNVKPPNAPNYTNNSFSPNYQDRNQNNYNNQYFGNRQNMPSTRQGPGIAMNQNEDVNKYSSQNRMYNENQDQMPQEQFYDSNAPFGGANIRNAGPPGPPRTIQPLMGSNIRPPVRPPLQDMSGLHNVNDYGGTPQTRRPMPENISPVVNQPIRPKWVEEPMFTPSVIVEYEHKPLRLKARDFIEPVHMFDYNHISKDGDNTKKKDFEREADELFTRMPRRSEKDDDMVGFDRYNRDLYSRDIYSRDYSRDFERRVPRDFDQRSEYRSRVPLREDFGERRRMDDRYDDRRRDDRDKYSRHDDSLRDRERERDLHREGDSHREKDLHREGDSYRERDLHREGDSHRERDLHREGDSHRDRDVHRERDSHRERNRDYRREDSRNRSKSREKDSRKRGHSKDSEVSDKLSKKAKDNGGAPVSDKVKHIVMIDDLLEPPGREMRPEKMIIILRGPPGSGKSYLAKLIRDREAEHGGTCRIMSIDDYFMQEGEIEEKDPATGKIIKKPSLKYEYDESSEETYLNSLKRAFKRSLTDGYFSFLIYDAVNDQLKNYADIWNFARQNGFQAYICTMDIDPQANFKRNIHNRKLEDIEVICSRFFPTPSHHIQLDATTLLQSAAITDVHMEDAEDEVIMVDAEDTEVESVFTSKWEKMDDAAQLARLDGISKPLRPSQLSMEDYLQLDDWRPNTAKPGKKTVRWADIEERRQQEKMRAIGFVVGQTDWNRMTDPTMGSSALTKTKYIERVRRNY